MRVHKNLSFQVFEGNVLKIQIFAFPPPPHPLFKYKFEVEERAERFASSEVSSYIALKEK